MPAGSDPWFPTRNLVDILIKRRPGGYRSNPTQSRSKQTPRIYSAHHPSVYSTPNGRNWRMCIRKKTNPTNPTRVLTVGNVETLECLEDEAAIVFWFVFAGRNNIIHSRLNGDVGTAGYTTPTLTNAAMAGCLDSQTPCVSSWFCMAARPMWFNHFHQHIYFVSWHFHPCFVWETGTLLFSQVHRSVRPWYYAQDERRRHKRQLIDSRQYSSCRSYLTLRGKFWTNKH